MKITSTDIARLAGVHRSTVDRVIHERGGVAPATKRKILQIIDEYNYKPNIMSRARLRKAKSLHIEALILAVDAVPDMKAGLAEAAGDYQDFSCRINVEATPLLEPETQAEALRRAVKRRPDAIILQALHADPVQAAIDEVVARGIPVVTINSDLPESRRQLFIGEAMDRSGSIAARLLGELIGGKGQVASITGEQTLVSVQERASGFRRTMAEIFPAITVLPEITVDESPMSTFNKVVDLLLDHPQLQGFFMSCGGVTACCRALEELGKEKDLRVITCETYPSIQQLMHKGIIDATLGSDLQEQSYLAAKFIILEHFFERPMPGGKYFLPTRIFVKENIG